MPHKRAIDFFKAQLEANIARTTGEIKAFWQNALEHADDIWNNRKSFTELVDDGVTIEH